ncbi:hypothetical protein E4T56_gene6739 [Termitomyces sp. T112]|nr:hypothetical protein E4T56_gene6739 [Termitomyces sp. T112]
MTVTHSSIQQLPSPPGAELLWGHEKIVFVNQPGLSFRKWIKQLGLAFRIKAAFGAPDILVLSDPAAITYILQKKIYDYHHSSTVRPRIARLLGKGLGWVEGETEHKQMKRLAMPALTADNVQAMSSDLMDCIGQVVAELKYFVQSKGNKTRINVLDWTGKATLNVVGRFAFLHDFEGGNSEDAQKILNARKAAVPVVMQYVAFLTLMLLRRFPVLNRLPIDVLQSQGLAKRTIQAGVAKEFIHRNQILLQSNRDKYSKDLLSRLLNAAAEGRITMSEVYEHISTFIISGFETTTTVVGFAAWELSRHPEKQARLREELLIVNGQPTYKDLYERLPYLDAVLKETLRLYPALPYMERVATKDDTLPLSQAVGLSDGSMAHELHIKAGQTVIIPIISIHRQDSVWDDPDDFQPERWLKPLPSQEKLSSGWSNLLAFSDGPRSCIGARLAIFDAKMILSLLVSNFSIEDTGGDLSLKIASSLQPWVRANEEDPGMNELPVCLKVL